ncbi:MAG: CxxC-x17-CxxC domain-containing protein [bacterium]
MSFGNDRQMFDVDVDCAKCGAHITQLPFQPSGDRPVYCSECNRAFRDSRHNQQNSQRRMYDVNLKCADCGTPITQLPFQPSGDTPVKCRDCYMKQRG